MWGKFSQLEKIDFASEKLQFLEEIQESKVKVVSEEN